jgi:hypothetical protein
MSPSTIAAASSGSSNSASTITDSACTGPPTKTGSPLSTRPASSSIASETVASAGRLSTSPIAPSSECSAISTTVLAKLGSTRAGEAMRSLPRSEAMVRLCPNRG